MRKHLSLQTVLRRPQDELARAHRTGQPRRRSSRAPSAGEIYRKDAVRTVQIKHRIVPFYTGILPRVLRSGMYAYEVLSVRWTLSHCKPYYCVMDQWCTDTKRGDAADMAKTVYLRNRHKQVVSMSVLDCRSKMFSFVSMRWIWVHVLSMSYGKIMRVCWSVILGLTAWVCIV